MFVFSTNTNTFLLSNTTIRLFYLVTVFFPLSIIEKQFLAENNITENKKQNIFVEISF